MSLAPITGDGGKLAAQAADQTQKTTPVQEFQGILKNGLNAIKEDMDSISKKLLLYIRSLLNFSGRWQRQSRGLIQRLYPKQGLWA